MFTVFIRTIAHHNQQHKREKEGEAGTIKRPSGNLIRTVLCCFTAMVSFGNVTELETQVLVRGEHVNVTRREE